MEKATEIFKPCGDGENATLKDSSESSIFLNEPVKRGKDKALKIRLDTLIKNAGLTQSEFYRELQISRQYWYFISWGLWDCPIEFKVKIARLLNTDSSVIWRTKEEPSPQSTEGDAFNYSEGQE